MRIYNAATVVLLVISVNLSILSEYIVLLLSTPEYIDAALMLILLTMPLSLSILNQLAAIGPNISRKTQYISYANVTGSIVNLTCLAVFLPIYGVVTVPICLLLSRATIFFLTSYYTKKEIGLKYSFVNVFVLISAIFLTLIFLQISNNKLLSVAVLIIFNAISFCYIFRVYNIKNLILRRV
jgi:O-antigen/teichoic acid export membrane protein